MSTDDTGRRKKQKTKTKEIKQYKTTKEKTKQKKKTTKKTKQKQTKKQKKTQQHTTQKAKMMRRRGLSYAYLLCKQLLRLYPHSNASHPQYTSDHRMCQGFYCEVLFYPCKEISHHSVKTNWKIEEANWRAKSKDNWVK